MPVRQADAQTLATPAATRGGEPCWVEAQGLVNEDQPVRIKIELAIEPSLSTSQDVGSVLFTRMCRLFLRVIACRAKKRRIVP